MACLPLFAASDIHAAQTQRNLVIAIDPVTDNGFNAMGVFYHMQEQDTCIVTTDYILQQTRLDKDLIKTNFFTYSYGGSLIILIPKKMAAIYNSTSGINLSGYCEYDLDAPSKLKSGISAPFLYPAALTVYSRLALRLIRNIFKKCDGVIWNVWVLGHGEPYGKTVGFTEGAFKQLLSFFKNDLNTRTFFYESCYAGGKMLEYVVGQEQYPFLLVCGCAGENFTFRFAGKNLAMSAISKLKNVNNVSDVTALFSSFIHTMNAPQIRLPHSTHFSTPNMKGAKIQESVDLNGHCIEKPGEIVYASKKIIGTKALRTKGADLLLDIHHLKNTLQLDEKINICSTLKGDSWHLLDLVEASTLSKYIFFDAFCGLAHYNPHIQKIYLVKEARCIGGRLTNVLILLNSVTPASSTPITEIFYLQGDAGFRMICCRDGSIQELAVSQELVSAYKKLFGSLQARIEAGKQPIRLFYNAWVRSGILWHNELSAFSLIGACLASIKLAKSHMYSSCALLSASAAAWWHKDKITSKLRFLDLEGDDFMHSYARSALAL